MKRLRRALAAVALTVVAVTGTAGWADAEEPAVTGPPPGTAAWRADDSLGERLPHPERAGPERIAAFFASLTGEQRTSLAHRHPLVVGNLDGTPVALRYEANRVALRTALRHERDKAAGTAADAQGRAEAREKAERYRSLLSPHRQILAFDPRGRGQVAEVYGDLAGAHHTAVVVPGSDIDLHSYDSTGPNRYGTPAGMAKSLRGQMARQTSGADSRTAVIAWTGYTTPVGIGPDAAGARLADAGAPRLARFLHGLSATGVPAPAVLCHSYGSVVCGKAAHDLSREDAADLVLFGSPGTGARSLAGLDTPVRVWATRSEGDWIGAVPHVQLLGLGHGTDPTASAFGARVVSSERAEGHTGYLVPGTGSLANFAAVALGSYDDVQCASEGCTDGI